MPAGEAFSQRQSDDIERAIRLAASEGPVRVSVYVGELAGEPRPAAQALHSRLDDPMSAVLVAVDPGSRAVEIVTGEQIRPHLDDRACALAALSMTSAFSAGDLAGGIADGVRMLGEHARAPRTLHTDQV